MNLILLLFYTSACWPANWAKTPNDNLKFEIGGVVPAFNFEMKAPSDVSTKSAKFSPNAPGKINFGLSYRNIGASVGATTPTSTESDQKKGATSASDYQLRFFGKRTYEFSYQSYQGMYIENSDQLDNSYQGTDNKIKRSDIKTKNFAFNFFWNFHEDDYSLLVGFDQGGRQKKSGWAGFGLLSYNYTDIQGDSAFIPTAATAQFGKLGDLKGLTKRSFVAGTGIGGILSVGNFYATSFLALGLGHQFLTSDYASFPQETDNKIASFLSLRAGFGYNGESNVLGLQLIVDSTSANVAGGEISSQTIEGKLFYAYRFDGVDMPAANWVSSLLD